MVNRIAAAISARLHGIRMESDRGDNPVPTAIIIAGLALLATVVVSWAVSRANAFMSTVPSGPAT